MTPEQELAALRAKVKVRKGKQGFEQNVREIEARIEELEAANGPN